MFPIDHHKTIGRRSLTICAQRQQTVMLLYAWARRRICKSLLRVIPTGSSLREPAFYRACGEIHSRRGKNTTKGTTMVGIQFLSGKRIKRGLAWFCLFVLLGLAGAGIIHTALAGISTVRQLAPAPAGGGGGDGGPT